MSVFEHLSCAIQHGPFPSGLYNSVGETCIPPENDEGNNQLSGEFSGHSEERELTIGGHGHMSKMDRI